MDKKYLKSVALYLISSILAILVIAYLCWHIVNGSGNQLEMMSAQIDSVNDTISLEAYIMREETILYSTGQGAGSINYLCSDGERVGVDAPLADIYESGGQDYRERIMEIDNKINVLENSSFSDNILIADTTIVDNRISELYKQLRTRLQVGDLASALSRKDELLTLLNKRQLIVKTVESYDGRIEQLRDKRDEITAGLQTVSETVKAERSGYFYASTDGYERIFSSRKVDSLTVADYDSMISSEPESYDAASGRSIGKLVTDYNWYLVCEIDLSLLRWFSKDGKTDIIFPYSSDTTISMTLYRTLEDADNNRAVLIFRSNRMPEGFSYLRCQTIQIIKCSYEGFRVPVTSVRVLDGVQGVYVLNGNQIEFKSVTPLIQSGGYYIVAEESAADKDSKYAPLALLDQIITKGRDLYDGKLIG